MRPPSDLRPYQQRIASYLYEHDEALNVLRPGGGKTAAALTAITELLRDGVIRHALIIAPKRVARVVWPDEIAGWAHTAGLTYQVLAGSRAQRELLLHRAAAHDLTIIGLDVVQWLLEQLEPLPADHPLFDLLVIDEISRLRNPKGVRAKVLARHAAKWKMIWGLSGTLRPNGAQDLFMPARIVTRGKLWGRSFYQWRQQYFYQTDFMGYDWKPLPGAEDTLNAAIAPLIITVDEGEMPKVEPLIVLDRVVLPLEARLQYDEMEERLFIEAGREPILAANAAVATGKLAQIANGFAYDASTQPHPMHDEKREWLEDIVDTAEGPTLLIYEYQADLAVLRDILGADLPYLGAGVSDKAAAANIAAWNAGQLPFMALHPASGGHGLNLQFGGADMAWIGPIWSPEYWEQTIARIARPGQTRPVVVRVCVASDTVDEMKLDRVQHKMSAQEAFEAYLRRWRQGARAIPLAL